MALVMAVLGPLEVLKIPRGTVRVCIHVCVYRRRDKTEGDLYPHSLVGIGWPEHSSSGPDLMKGCLLPSSTVNN